MAEISVIENVSFFPSLFCFLCAVFLLKVHLLSSYFGELSKFILKKIIWKQVCNILIEFFINSQMKALDLHQK